MTNSIAQTMHLDLTTAETEALEHLARAPLDKLDPARASFDLATACQYYNSAKHLIPLLESLVGKIPVYGPQIKTVLGYLTMIADFACPAPGAQAALAASGPRALAPDHHPAAPGLILQQVPIRYMDESGDYKSATITNGYGMVAKAGVAVTRGATATIQVDITVDCVSTQDFKTWFDERKSNFSNEQWHKLEENYAAGGFLGGVLLGCFGFLFGGGTYNHYKNEHKKQVTASDTKQDGFMKSLHMVTNSKVKVSGSVTAVGQSLIPTTAAVFVETTQVDFQDGKSLTVINSSAPEVADQNGKTGDVSGSGQLSLVNL